jgi:cell division protein FtsZ
MASPQLDAGAIDGARGILINITGSSSLKLSEVNEASSLIQSAAHEDANIIFGAVLDEKMGDEVKITVIATGFRDQMPERRARMLSVGEVAMVEEPVVSVPVESAGTWMKEPALPEVRAALVAPFLSDEEEEQAVEPAEPEDGFFSASSAPSAASRSTVTVPVQAAAPNSKADFDEDFGSGFASGFGPGEPEMMAATSAKPKFAELGEEPAYTPLPRDYASDFGSGVRGTAEVEEHRAQPATAVFTEPDEASQRDLDTPTFLRRFRF